MPDRGCSYVQGLLLALTVTTSEAFCQKKEVTGNLSLPGHQPMPVRYNVCVDNTTISPVPSMDRSGEATFIRDCCGCRVSSVTERELRLRTLAPPSFRRSVYVPEIQTCECIPCDVSAYEWARYFLFLSQRKK